jgi:hypothetical protein
LRAVRTLRPLKLMIVNTNSPTARIRFYVRNAIRNATSAPSIGFPSIRHPCDAVAVGTTTVPATLAFKA